VEQIDRTPEPTNDHEAAIAEAIDRKDPNITYGSIVAEIAVSVPFDMSIADTQFLVTYAHWRLVHPMKKQPTREMPPEDLKRSG